MMTKVFFLCVLSAAILPASRADAEPIPVAIVRYDITNAIVSGSGGWAHVYTGTITPTSGPETNYPVANYRGGGGTLNDGVIGTSVLDTQLFDVGARTVITLHL